MIKIITRRFNFDMFWPGVIWIHKCVLSRQGKFYCIRTSLPQASEPDAANKANEDEFPPICLRKKGCYIKGKFILHWREEFFPATRFSLGLHVSKTYLKKVTYMPDLGTGTLNNNLQPKWLHVEEIACIHEGKAPEGDDQGLTWSGGLEGMMLLLRFWYAINPSQLYLSQLLVHPLQQSHLSGGTLSPGLPWQSYP